MGKIDKTRENIQIEAFNNWKAFNCKGTVLIPTGVGKSFVAIKAILYVKELIGINNPINILHLSERVIRKDTFEKEITTYQELYQKDVRNNITIHYYRYQGYSSIPTNIVYDLVICDEVHESLCPTYFDVYYRIKYNRIIGLTALIPNNSYDLPDGSTISKWKLVQIHTPICYNCTLKTSLKVSASRSNNLFFIKCKLTDAELLHYKQLSSDILLYKNTLKSKTLGNLRALFLNNTEQKLKVCDMLIRMNNYHKLPSVMFTTDLNPLKKLLPDSYLSGANKNKYKTIFSAFNKIFYTIGSYKILKQGINLGELDNCILVASNNANLKLDTIQRTGRLRKSENKSGNVIVIVNEDTLELNYIFKISEILQIPLDRINIHDNFIDFYNKYIKINNIPYDKSRYLNNI